jgi:hypothetical protein
MLDEICLVFPFFPIPHSFHHQYERFQQSVHTPHYVCKSRGLVSLVVWRTTHRASLTLDEILSTSHHYSLL